MSASPIAAYEVAVDKIEGMFEDMSDLITNGVIKTTNQPDGMLKRNQVKAKKILDELVDFVKTPNTGYAAFDFYIIQLMGVRQDQSQTYQVWNNYGCCSGMLHSNIPWMNPYIDAVISGTTIGWRDAIPDQVNQILDSLQCVIDPEDYDISSLPCGDHMMQHRHICWAFAAARSLVEISHHMTDPKDLSDKCEALCTENKILRAEVNGDRREVLVLKAELEVISNENKLLKTEAEDDRQEIQQLKSQIDADHLEILLLKSKIDSVERKFAPELIAYDYEKIKSRLDPIRDELKMMSRVFGRAVRLRYTLPVAIAVTIK